MNFFNKITDFLFPKKEKSTIEEMTAEELQELSNELLPAFGSTETLMYMLLGTYFGYYSNKNDRKQKVKRLIDVAIEQNLKEKDQERQSATIQLRETLSRLLETESKTRGTTAQLEEALAQLKENTVLMQANNGELHSLITHLEAKK
jgi:predicted RNA-binding Zn ribbon-like protein